jgi:hypothetical protein
MMYRFNMRPRTRKDAQSGGDLVRYFQRQAEFAPHKDPAMDKDVDYMTRQGTDTITHDDLRGEPLIGNLPAWAENDAGRFFAAANREERANGQYAIAFQIALPCELTHDQHMDLAQEFVDAVMHDKPYLVVKHEPVTNGQAQPHLHILMSPRTIDGTARTEQQHFRRWNPDHPEQGGAQKDRFWNQRQTPQKVREAFSDLANRALEMAGADERIDPRSLWKRGVDRERISWKNRVVLDPATKAREQRQAADAWAQRKAYKGLDDLAAISREEFVLLVRQWTRDYVKGKEVERSSREAVDTWYAREGARREAALVTLEAAHQTVQRARQGAPVSSRDLMAALAVGEEHGPRRGLTMHLTEEKAYGR